MVLRIDWADLNGSFMGCLMCLESDGRGSWRYLEDSSFTCLVVASVSQAVGWNTYLCISMWFLGFLIA